MGGEDALRWFRQQGSTTHFDVIDAQGNALGCTHSLGSGFGSGVTVPGTGVTLNNFMRWNDMDPRNPTAAKPGARAFPLRNWLFTPELQWQSRGKCRF